MTTIMTTTMSMRMLTTAMTMATAMTTAAMMVMITMTTTTRSYLTSVNYAARRRFLFRLRRRVRQQKHHNQCQHQQQQLSPIAPFRILAQSHAAHAASAHRFSSPPTPSFRARAPTQAAPLSVGYRERETSLRAEVLRRLYV